MSSRQPARLVAGAFLIPLIPLLLAHLVFVPVYRTNDDVGMNMLAAGVGFTSEPTPLLIFSHHWLGQALNAAYSSFPGVPWYHLYGVLALYLSGAVFAWVALCRRASVTRVALLVLYNLTFGLIFAASSHFTIASCVCAIAASLFWHDRASHGERLGVMASALFATLWLAAGLIRYQSAALVFLMSVPLFVFHAGRVLRESSRETGARHAFLVALLPATLAGLLVAGTSWTHIQRYAADPAWADYVDTFDPISGLIDYGRGAVEPEDTWMRDRRGRPILGERAYAESAYAVAEQVAGWSRNDYDMMMEWFFANPELYTAEKLSRVLERLPQAELGRFDSLRLMRLDDHLMLLCLTALAPLVFLGRNRAAWRATAAILLGVLAVLVYLVVFLDRLPSWIYQPIFAFLCCHAILVSSHTPVLTSAGRVRSWPAVFALTLAILPQPTSWLKLRLDGRETKSANAIVKATLDKFDGELYVVWGTSFPYEAILPTDDLRVFETMPIYSVGGDVRGAFNAAQLEQRRIPDIYRAIYRYPGIYVISDERLNRLFVKYVEEHYGDRVEAKETLRIMVGVSRLFSVYRFEAQPRVPRPGASSMP